MLAPPRFAAARRLCYRTPMRKSLVLLAFSLICCGAAAQALRTLPAVGERGTTGENLALPDVKIDRRVMRLAPGAVIFDRYNRTMVHAHLPAGADVFYTRNGAGEVQRIYVLTDAERAQLTAKPRPKVAPAAAAVQR